MMSCFTKSTYRNSHSAIVHTRLLLLLGSALSTSGISAHTSVFVLAAFYRLAPSSLFPATSDLCYGMFADRILADLQITECLQPVIPGYRASETICMYHIYRTSVASLQLNILRQTTSRCPPDNPPAHFPLAHQRLLPFHLRIRPRPVDHRMSRCRISKTGLYEFHRHYVTCRRRGCESQECITSWQWFNARKEVC